MNAHAPMSGSPVGRFGHDPDPCVDAEKEILRLQDDLRLAKSGLVRALDYRATTREDVAVKHSVRYVLRRLGFVSRGEDDR